MWMSTASFQRAQVLIEMIYGQNLALTTQVALLTSCLRRKERSCNNKIVLFLELISYLRNLWRLTERSCLFAISLINGLGKASSHPHKWVLMITQALELSWRGISDCVDVVRCLWHGLPRHLAVNTAGNGDLIGRE